MGGVGWYASPLFRYSLLASFFLGGALLQRGLLAFDLRPSYFVYTLAISLFILLNYPISLHRWFSALFALFFAVSLLKVLAGRLTLPLFMKQFFGIGLSVLLFYNYLRRILPRISLVFGTYFNLCYMCAFLSIVQQASYLVGFKYGYDLSWAFPNWSLSGAIGPFLRCSSVFPEPSHMSIVLTPATYLALRRILRPRTTTTDGWKSSVVLLAMLFSFSSTGYFGILVSIVLIYSYQPRPKHIVLGLLLMPFATAAMFLGVDRILEQVVTFQSLIIGEKDLTALSNTASGLSVYALASNAYVAFRSFLSSPLFGNGLGSHLVSYETYLSGAVRIADAGHFLNAHDANSLLLRLLSETGLVGVCSVLFFIIRNNSFKTRIFGYREVYWVNHAIIPYFAVVLLRGGHYFAYGNVFFFCVYYFSHQLSVTLGKNQIARMHH